MMLCLLGSKGLFSKDGGIFPSNRKTGGLESVSRCRDASIKRTGTCEKHFFFATLTVKLQALGIAENLRIRAAVTSTAII